MSEMGAGIRDEDWDEMEDTADAVLTEEYLEGRRSWPLGSSLPLKRFTNQDAGVEVGYVLPRAVTRVIMDDGSIRVREYASVKQVVEAGWRAD